METMILCTSKSSTFKKFFSLIVFFILLFGVFIHLITGSCNDIYETQQNITIINVQSYPVVGGTWVVMFTTVGTANLTITPVNGTTWSDITQDCDLQFIEIRNGNATINYEWTDTSVFIQDFSSNTTCYVRSKVLTAGRHTLMFHFGNSTAYANNLAFEGWIQTTTNDFNNGTKININVSDNAFHLTETFYHRNTTRMNNESFEGSWPPTDWEATGQWKNNVNQTYHGSYAAGFDGSTTPSSGNLTTPPLNCSHPNATAIYVDFWNYNNGTTMGDYYLDYYNGSSWNQISRLDNVGSDSWAHYTDTITDSQYFNSSFRTRWRVIQLDDNTHVYVDDVTINLEKNESGYVTIGNLISTAHDTGRILPFYNNITVTNSTLSGTTLTAWTRSADTEINLSNAPWYIALAQVPHKRWIQWRINLTGDENHTPVVNSVNITWGYDVVKPMSSVNPIVPYWHNSTPYEITATAIEDETGIKEVALYASFRPDNTSGWSAWSLYGTNDTQSPYSWSFTPPSGDGLYRFYSVATDNGSNLEEFTGNDTSSGYDTLKPASTVNMITPYWRTSADNPLPITATTDNDLSGVKNITLYYRFREDNSSSYGPWTSFLKKKELPWGWDFTFSNGTGHYQFYSVGNDTAGNKEDSPNASADAMCYYRTPVAPVINSYDLRDKTASKLNNDTGLLNVNAEYFFTVNVTDLNRWADIEYINITAWYDNGDDNTVYNQTKGGNLNMNLQYENTTGVAHFRLLWPDNEAQLISGNCTETTIDNTTKTISISFKPNSQVRWANSNETWDGTQNTTNDPYSWNFNISVTDAKGLIAWQRDEYGVYKYSSITPNQNWVNILVVPGASDTTNIVTVSYSSNYDFNMTIYFEENLTNPVHDGIIYVADNVYIMADADLYDDIIEDKPFQGIKEENAIEIFNSSGIFQHDNISQTVDVQFAVFIPLGTLGGTYTAHIATKIFQK